MYYSKVDPEMQVPDAGAGPQRDNFFFVGAGAAIFWVLEPAFGGHFCTTHKEPEGSRETFRQIDVQSKNDVPKWKNEEKMACDFLLNPRLTA